MKIIFFGNEPALNYYFFGVVQNHKTSRILFILNKIQDTIDLSLFKPFLKMVNRQFNIFNKDGNLELIDETDGKLTFEYILERNVMQINNYDMQLQFENVDIEDEPVWQTQVFNITFSESINADDEIAKTEPAILINHEARISALENGKGESVLEYENRLSFPNVGKKNTIYIDASSNILYRFDEETSTYYIAGTNYNDIIVIDGN